jgi:thiol-disulfide isomerase/thioredoxin
MPRRLLQLAAFVVIAAGWPQANGYPDLNLTNLEGKTHSLAEYRGKVVVLNFWATWCPPCRDEMPMLSKLAAKYDEQNVAFLAVSLDDSQTQSKIPRFVKKKKISVPIFTGATPETLKRLELGEIVPATMIFDRNGTPVFRIEGEASRNDIASRVNWLLSERSTRQPKALIKNY